MGEKNQPTLKLGGLNTKPSTGEGKGVVKELKIHVFFDGTGNNYYNAEAYRTKGVNNGRSYANYFSNIALLWANTDTSDYDKKVYIEGAGTKRYEADWKYLTGSASADGSSGVYERVAVAFDEVNKVIAGYIKKFGKGFTLSINVYGFSRGAFYGRFFCALIADSNQALRNSLRKKYPLNVTLVSPAYPIYSPDNTLIHKSIDKYNIPEWQPALATKSSNPSSIVQVNIPLVFLLDTVSSYAVLTETPESNVKEFGLNIGNSPLFHRIIHIIAKNDYRKYFKPINIATAIRAKKGYECVIPGSHSDIGGGYPEVYKEDQLYLSASPMSTTVTLVTQVRSPEKRYVPTKTGEIHHSWFVDKGYYDPVKEIKHKAEKDYYSLVYGSRKVYYNIQFVMYEVMKEISTRFFLKIKPNSINHKKNIENYPELLTWQQTVLSHILKNYNENKTDEIRFENSSLSAPLIESIYHRFIHNSLNPRWVVESEAERQGIEGIDRLKPVRPIIQG